MTRKQIWPVIMVCALALHLAAFEVPSVSGKKAGYALLDMYVKCFQELARSGSGGPGAPLLEKSLQTMQAENKRAKEHAEIDIFFYAHFSRMLALTKLIVTLDPGKILEPVIAREAANFIKDVTGEDVITSGGAPAIGQLANALTEEIINLQIYLDTLDKREGLRKRFEESLIGPKK